MHWSGTTSHARSATSATTRAYTAGHECTCVAGGDQAAVNLSTVNLVGLAHRRCNCEALNEVLDFGTGQLVRR
ncbi:hypothetical protein CH305_00925 [Rhodococcus sp. 15-649-2-2]|nr:hypothetical protein CH305_00925 [Rhodococcus sp. 15-649-2-2]